MGSCVFGIQSNNCKGAADLEKDQIQQSECYQAILKQITQSKSSDHKVNDAEDMIACSLNNLKNPTMKSSTKSVRSRPKMQADQRKTSIKQECEVDLSKILDEGESFSFEETTQMSNPPQNETASSNTLLGNRKPQKPQEWSHEQTNFSTYSFQGQLTWVERTERMVHNIAKSTLAKSLIAETYGDLRVELQEVDFENGCKYEGQWLNGNKEGMGKQTETDGSYYIGYWKNNKAEGHGIMKTLNGSDYEGEWLAGSPHGKGRAYDSIKRCTFMGIWRNGKMNGNILETWDDGTEFQGEYVNDLRNGKGKIQFADGSSYQGDFVNNCISGIGTYNWPKHRKYHGSWVMNNMHGKGRMQQANKTIYEGDFVNSKREGVGECLWPNGNKYIGSWERDKQHGVGELILPSGEVKNGIWMHGKLRDLL